MPVELKSPHLQHPGRDALRTQRGARTGPRAPRYVIRQAGVCQRGIRPLFASTKKTALSPGQRAPTPGLLGTRPGDRRTRRRTRPSRAVETTKDGVGVSLFSAVSAGRALSPTGAGARLGISAPGKRRLRTGRTTGKFQRLQVYPRPEASKLLAALSRPLRWPPAPQPLQPDLRPDPHHPGSFPFSSSAPPRVV